MVNEKDLEKVMLEPDNTLLGKFQTERTNAISEMFDNVSENGIYPTSKFFARLDNCVRQILEAIRPQVDEDGILSGEERDKAWRAGWHNGGGQIGALNSTIKAQKQADDTRWREKIEGVFKEIEQSLDICEDMLGFCSISNHVPFSEYQNLKSRILDEK